MIKRFHPKFEFKKGHIPWHKGKKTGLVPKSAYKKGSIPFMTGKHHTEKTIEKIRNSRRGKMVGINHPNYIDGRTPERNKIRGSFEYKQWERGVRDRDGCCKRCGEKRIRYLMAHHIKNFSAFVELRFLLDNGVTFCRDCHKIFHHIYGKKNNTKEQVEDFLGVVG